MPLVYATRTQLVDYAPANLKTRVPDEPEATRLLTSASKDIRRATKTAIYATDVDGYPTDTAVRTAFQNATCAQALWWVANPGEEDGTAGQFTNVSIGSLSLSRGSGNGSNRGGSGGGGPRLATKAETELRDAGVLAGSIVASYLWEGWL
ncbi:hypothetical protein [Amycolatopsis plumensis]|uniref:Uncharacterized protein n=1 Tax=Amycolatopsis plumensis TaxID=236508 RepID=A0ABV5U8H1_9PSEU